MSAVTCPSWCTDHQNPGHPEDERHRTVSEISDVYAGYEIVEYIVGGKGPEFFFWGDGSDPLYAEDIAEMICEAMDRLRAIRDDAARVAV